MSMTASAERILSLETQLAAARSQHLRASSQADTLEQTVGELRTHAQEQESFLRSSQDKVSMLSVQVAAARAEAEKAVLEATALRKQLSTAGASRLSGTPHTPLQERSTNIPRYTRALSQDSSDVGHGKVRALSRLTTPCARQLKHRRNVTLASGTLICSQVHAAKQFAPCTVRPAMQENSVPRVMPGMGLSPDDCVPNQASPDSPAKALLDDDARSAAETDTTSSQSVSSTEPKAWTPGAVPPLGIQDSASSVPRADMPRKRPTLPNGAPIPRSGQPPAPCSPAAVIPVFTSTPGQGSSTPTLGGSRPWLDGTSGASCRTPRSTPVAPFAAALSPLCTTPGTAATACASPSHLTPRMSVHSSFPHPPGSAHSASRSSFSRSMAYADSSVCSEDDNGSALTPDLRRRTWSYADYSARSATGSVRSRDRAARRSTLGPPRVWSRPAQRARRPLWGRTARSAAAALGAGGVTVLLLLMKGRTPAHREPDAWQPSRRGTLSMSPFGCATSTTQAEARR